MGRRRGESFKEYIKEELHCFAEGMLTATKQDFKFVSIFGGTYKELVDVTRTTVVSDYQPAIEKNKNEYDSTVTKIFGKNAVN